MEQIWKQLDIMAQSKSLWVLIVVFIVLLIATYIREINNPEND